MHAHTTGVEPLAEQCVAGPDAFRRHIGVEVKGSRAPARYPATHALDSEVASNQRQRPHDLSTTFDKSGQSGHSPMSENQKVLNFIGGADARDLLNAICGTPVFNGIVR
jgi:hypothetical protein